MQLAAGVLAALLAPIAGADSPTEDLEQLRSRIRNLQKQLAQSEESRSEAADALRESERAISETNRTLFELARAQRGLRGELGRIRSRQADLQARVRTQQDRIARLLYQQYLAGPSEPIRLLLSQQDPNELARRMHYLSHIYRARAELIAGLRRDLTHLDQLATETREKDAELERLQSAQARSRSQLEKQRSERRAVLAKVSSEIARQRREIGTLRRDEARLARLVEKLARELEAQAPPRSRASGERLRTDRLPEGGITDAFPQLKGSLRPPVRGELANRFGSPRQGTGLAWKGVLIRARPGAEVHAVAAGRVVFADWLRGFGNLLILDHGYGYLSLYGYNEALLKQVGDAVASGEPIGTVGASGGAQETGLYFEIRFQGRPVDPLRWIALK
jgi:septal ring factor EnvC (AmiA/AmiB activator)